MTSEAEQPANLRLDPVSTQFTLALRRAILLLTQWSARPQSGSASTAVAESTAEAAMQGGGDHANNRSRDTLPWWVSHHPALSFRGRDADERHD